MEKNNQIKALSHKKDFDLIRKQGLSFSYKWLKGFFVYREEEKKLKVAWSLPKKHISNSVTRNRLKRWGRENLKRSTLKGIVLMIFLSQAEKSFYKKLKRRDFDHVFNKLLEKFYSET